MVQLTSLYIANPGRAGVYASIPLAIHIVTILMFARLCDYIASIWEKRKIRQIFIIFGFFIGSGMIVLTKFVFCSITNALVILGREFQVFCNFCRFLTLF